MDYRTTQQFENWSSTPYTDTRGNPTVGWGFNLNDAFVSSLIPKAVRQGKRELTKKEAEPIFQALYSRAQIDAQNAIGEQYYKTLPEEAQYVFTDMSYNLGAPKFNKFRNMIGAARNQDWQGVSREMQNSKWYNQVGNRSRALQSQILSLSGNQQPKSNSFGDTFANARKAGLKVFEWNGKLYSTEVK